MKKEKTGQKQYTGKQYNGKKKNNRNERTDGNRGKSKYSKKR